jgi:hypothetical protein
MDLGMLAQTQARWSDTPSPFPSARIFQARSAMLLFSTEIVILMSWSIWTARNNLIFNARRVSSIETVYIVPVLNLQWLHFFVNE